jgi:hypothetical protein
MSAPDAVEPLVGWRYWKVTSGGLASLNVDGGYWPPGAPHEATCKGVPVPTLRGPHVVPCEWCGCGIYAARDLETLKQLVYPFTDSLFRRRRIAVGEVALWGRVIEGERGYRAQYAYPKSLYLLPRKQDDGWCRFSEVALARAYEVPVGRLSEKVAVGRNPELRALYGLLGMASASMVLGALAAKAAAQQQRKALEELRDASVGGSVS